METFLLLRRTHRRERVFLDRTLEYLDDIDPVSRCGFPGRVSQKLINDADPIVRRPTYKSNAIPTHFQVTVYVASSLAYGF